MTNKHWQIVTFDDMVHHINEHVELSELEIYVGLEHLYLELLKVVPHGHPASVIPISFTILNWQSCEVL